MRPNSMEPNRDKKIQEDINQLILIFNPRATENFREEIRSYSRRVFGSAMYSRDGSDDPSVSKHKILQKVSRMYDSGTVGQCQIALDRFVNSNTMTKKGEFLKALFKISDDVDKANQSFNSKIFDPKPLHTTGYNLNQTQPSFTQLNVPQPSNQSQVIRKYRERGDPSHKISESAILKDITFALSSVEGEYLIFEEDHYNLHPNVKVTETVRRIVRELSDIGWLFNRIANSSKQDGVISKALKLAINEEMKEYYRWLAIIEGMINSEELTLRKMIMWTYQPFQKLKWLTIILESVEHFSGCQIISIVNSYRPQGDQKINKLLNDLLGNLLQPLFQFIYNWVYKGELIDEYKQFFIARSEQVPDQWNDKYRIIRAFIPNILDAQTAYKIFLTGKTIHYLKNKCKHNYVIKEPFIDTKTIMDTQMHESTNIFSENFKNWVYAVDQETNRELVRVLFQQFKLKLHLDAMKKFFLFGQGDFIQHLADSLKEQLAKPKHQIFEYNLETYITDAIKFCFSESKKLNQQARYFREHILSRVMSKKMEQGTDGWDVFNFTYGFNDPPTDDPIYSVLSPETISNYQKIFSFLWRVKRIEQGLKALWLVHAKGFLNMNSQTQAIFHYCYILRNSMIHFLNNLFGYLMIAIESVWDQFMVSLKQARNFDQILDKHKAVINQILSITMTTPKFKSIGINMGRVFSIINNFIMMDARFQQELEQYNGKKKQYQNMKKLEGMGINSLNESSEVYEKEIPTFSQTNIMKKFQEIGTSYKQNFDQFFDSVKKEEQALSVLIFRLNFNGYYSTSNNQS